MKILTVRLNEEENNMLNAACEKDNKKASEIIREALKMYCQAADNQTKELQEAENKNKQLAFAVDSLKAILQEKESAKQEQKDLYERMLQDLNVDKTNMQDLIQQLKTDSQRKGAEVEFLQGKVEEIKKAGLFKRLFLRIA